MMKIRLIYTIVLTMILQKVCVSKGLTNITTSDFHGFEHFLHFQNDSVYVINFWATWCVPCRKELPEFEKITDQYKNEKVKVLLVSLDFASQINQSLIPFLNNNHITAEVILLNDPNSNAWIDKVDPSWSGSIPATLIYKRNNRQFFEKELDYKSLDQTIHELLYK
jgi:thiol-disulfide isomerase/thioredoxin